MNPSKKCFRWRIISDRRPNQTLRRVTDKLEIDGVLAVNDLQFVIAEDLTGLLKPIETRKLLKEWQNTSDIGPSTPLDKDLHNSETLSPDRPSTSVNEIAHAQPSTSNNLSSNPSWPYTLHIPFEKLPVAVRKCLDKGERLIGNPRRKLIHFVADACRELCAKPLRKHLVIIARRVHEKYQNAIVDKLNGKVIGTGYETFSKQLVTRAENLNRAVQNPLKRRHNERQPTENNQSTSNLSISKQMDSYGCISWQPQISEEEENTLAQRREELRALWEDQDRDEFCYVDSIKSTYALQRMNINSGDGLRKLNAEWPFLFTESGLLCHFTELTGIDLLQTFISAMREKSSRIMTFCRSGVTGKKQQEACWKVKDRVDDARMSTGSSAPALLGVVELIVTLLDEDMSALFQLADEFATTDEVDMSRSPNNPFLFCCGDSLFTAKRLMLVIDSTVVIPNIKSVLSALALLFASFYCFNIHYPDEAAASLEFIQRCFVGICPDSGSKSSRSSKKKTPQTNPKVLSLISSLADFEWSHAATLETD